MDRTPPQTLGRFMRIQAAAALAGIGTAIGVAVILVVDQGPWTVVPAHSLALVAVFPLMAVDLHMLMHESTRSAIVKKGRPVWAVSSLVMVYTLGILASEGFVMATSLMDDCDEELGEGTYKGREVTVVYCQASFHEAEEWLQIHPVSWRRKKHGVGFSGQEHWARRLDHAGAREIHPHPDSPAVFASKPVHAEVEGTILRVHFEEGAVKEVDLER